MRLSHLIAAMALSIFVAAPILVDLDKKDKLTKEEDKEMRIEELKKMA